MRFPWTIRRTNQSILKEISPEYILEGLMLKLKLQYFGHLMRRTDSCEETLMLGKIEDGRRRGRQSMRWLDASQELTTISRASIKYHRISKFLYLACASYFFRESWAHHQLNGHEIE